MSVLTPERTGVPRSAVRYRPIGTDQATGPGSVGTRARPGGADARSPVVPVADDLDLEDDEEKRALPRRRTSTSASRRAVTPPVRTRSQIHPLFFVGVGLLVTIVLWIVIAQIIAWGTGVLDLWRYGNPRTYQVDAVVGQGDSAQSPSHFLVLNLQSQIVIVDFPAGDPSKAREFVVSSILSQNSEQIPVTIRFLDVSHNGRPDMIIRAGGAQAFLVNTGSTFRPPLPAEQQQILRTLQQGNN